MVAAENGHRKLVCLLLNSKASIAITDCYGMGALHVASAWGQLQIVELLLQVGEWLFLTKRDNPTQRVSVLMGSFFQS